MLRLGLSLTSATADLSEHGWPLLLRIIVAADVGGVSHHSLQGSAAYALEKQIRSSMSPS
jgi:hypothetical protein